MKITNHKSKIRALKHGDPGFYVQDNFVITPRAGFEILKECPKEYRMIITTCINNGWLKPVAHITERELLFIGLTKN